jgi:hypothetical protein
MSESYVIQWKSKVNGRVGKGSKVLSREDAQRLAAELNRDYPDIQHEIMPADADPADILIDRQIAPPEPAGGESEETEEEINAVWGFAA